MQIHGFTLLATTRHAVPMSTVTFFLLHSDYLLCCILMEQVLERLKTFFTPVVGLDPGKILPTVGEQVGWFWSRGTDTQLLKGSA